MTYFIATTVYGKPILPIRHMTADEAAAWLKGEGRFWPDARIERVRPARERREVVSLAGAAA